MNDSSQATDNLAVTARGIPSWVGGTFDDTTIKISVVAAAYNSRETIAYTIESFLARSHADKEMLVIDGVSSDDTVRIVESLPPSISACCPKRTTACSTP